LRPELVLILSELVEILPGIDPGIVPVGELRLHRIGADRLERADLDVTLSGLQNLLPGP
jgi:hypothetical protein